MNKNTEYVLIGASVAAILWMSFDAARNNKAPGKEVLDAAGMLGVVQLNIPTPHHVDAGQIDGPIVTVPVQYPTTTGEGITSVIRSGWDFANVRPMTDYDWIINPPADRRI